MRAAFALLLLLAPSIARAETADGKIERGVDKGTFGVGIIFGEPTGICAKLYLSDDRAIQAALGISFVGGGAQANVDYVFHPFILQTRDSFVLATYIGPGVRLNNYSDGTRGESFFALGLRATGGLLFDFKKVPLDAFLELAGVLEYGFKDMEGAGLAFNAGVGIRYYF